MADTTNPVKETLNDPFFEEEVYDFGADSNDPYYAKVANEVYNTKTKMYERFVANLRTNDYAMSNRFVLEFEVPNFSQEVRTQLKTAGVKEMSERLILNAESVDLPNRILPAIDPRVGNFQIPFAHDYSSDIVQAQFRCSGDMFEKKVFDAWQATAVSINTGNANYPTNYKRDILIKMLNRQMEVVYVVRLVGAFPSNISNISLNHDSTEITKFSVSFRYAWWVVEGFEQETNEFPLDVFKTEFEAEQTAEQSADNRLAKQATQVAATFKEMDEQINRANDAESGNILDRMSSAINKYLGGGGSIKDGAKYFKSLKNDIDSINDANVLDQANKLQLGNGINKILGFLK